ncbi:MAG TPA: TraM recognition domain-containing protein [Bacteriovoracaceae bacterium]|nr:TraM recognition domain-containing protein [Bacteriovoracaceae bacterium]
MLFKRGQALGPDELGWSVNQKGVYKLQYLSPHLHTFIIGASGWGKTNLLNILMEDNLKSGRPVIFIDPKGTKESIKHFESMCRMYKRKCYVFSEHSPGLKRFNPLASLDADQALIMIMRSFDWGDSPNEYYLNCSRKALKQVLDNLYSSQIKFGLLEVYKELEAKHGIEETSGLRTQLYLLTHSAFGNLFDVSNEETPMNFKKAWEEGACLYLGISTMGYGTLARTVGKMFVSELQTLAHNIGTKFDKQEDAIQKSIGVFIDEAGSVLFPDFIDLANKARSSGINLTIAVQSYSDMEMVSRSETLMKQLMESFSTWFIQRQLNPENTEKLASIFGTYLSEKKTVVTEGGLESSKGSLREAYEYFCHPDVLKSINIGQALLLTLNPKDIHLLNIRDAKATQDKKEEQKENKNFEALRGEA